MFRHIVNQSHEILYRNIVHRIDLVMLPFCISYGSFTITLVLLIVADVFITHQYILVALVFFLQAVIVLSILISLRSSNDWSPVQVESKKEQEVPEPGDPEVSVLSDTHPPLPSDSSFHSYSVTPSATTTTLPQISIPFHIPEFQQLQQQESQISLESLNLTIDTRDRHPKSVIEIENETFSDFN